VVNNFKSALYKFITVILLYVFSSALIQYVMYTFIVETFKIDVSSYKIYVDVIAGLLFGYLIVYYFSEIVYWSFRSKYDHSTSAAVRSLFRLLGIGAMLATMAGAISNPTAGVALGGFIGMIVGYASQQTLGQIMAGIFILLSRPFMIGDRVEIAGVNGYIEDITALFVVISTDDGKLIYLPCNTVISSRITKYKGFRKTQENLN